MEELPWAPEAAELRRLLEPEIRTLPAGTELWRLYFRGGPHPRSWKEFRRFGPVASARFDHHLSEPPAESERGVLYAALSVRTCVAEVFQE